MPYLILSLVSLFDMHGSIDWTLSSNLCLHSPRLSDLKLGLLVDFELLVLTRSFDGLFFTYSRIPSFLHLLSPLHFFLLCPVLSPLPHINLVSLTNISLVPTYTCPPVLVSVT